MSRSAASRALTGTGYVGEDSRRRVLEAAAQLGYVPHLAARYLKDRVSRCVGVVCLDLQDPADAALVAGVCAGAREEVLATMVADLGGRVLGALEGLRDFVAFGVAGVVVAPVSAEPVGYLGRYGIPVVEAGRRFAPGRGDAVVTAPGSGRGSGHLIAHEMGRAAVGLLVRRFAGPDLPAETVVLRQGTHGRPVRDAAPGLAVPRPVDGGR
ncbi:MAG: LacI family DNA-binding transcriptional regulator [Actinotalea sp.]|nr:LacI family DNA-binding transcriptional regulator [Actinotalea sp.]